MNKKNGKTYAVLAGLLIALLLVFLVTKPAKAGYLVVSPLEPAASGSEIHEWFSSVTSNPPGKTRVRRSDQDMLLVFSARLGDKLAKLPETKAGVSMKSPFWLLMEENWPGVVRKYLSEHPGGEDINLVQLAKVVGASDEYRDAAKRVAESGS